MTSVHFYKILCKSKNKKENFNLKALENQIMDFENLTVEEFKTKYNYTVYSL
jgi:hypothetical protein